jgi:hypothetical protein
MDEVHLEYLIYTCSTWLFSEFEGGAIRSAMAME